MSWRQHEAPERLCLSIDDEVDDVPAWILPPRRHFRERHVLFQPGHPARRRETGSRLCQILLNESRTDVNVELQQRLVADVREAVNLACFHDENVACSRFARFAVDDPSSASLLDECDFVVGMPMRSGPAAGRRVDEIHRHRDVALVRTDELMRHADEWKILLTDSVHESED